MTVAHRLNTADGDLPCRADHHLTIDRDGVDPRAPLWPDGIRSCAVWFQGANDARNIDRVSAYAARLVRVELKTHTS